MTDHGQLDQDPQIVAFSPELLKLADRRRQALEDCRQAAEDGDANAAVQMGVNCLYGVNGVEKDPKKAFYWFSQTAEDDPAGLYWRALCYDNGLGVDQDEDWACRLYQESAAHGYAPALCNLGVCYESGQGVEKDPAKAVELYRQAADQGYPMGRCNLGVMYFLARGWRRTRRRRHTASPRRRSSVCPGPSTCWACAANSATAWSGTYPGLWPCTGRRRTPDIPTPSAPWGCCIVWARAWRRTTGRQPACSARRRRGLSPGLALPGTEL